MLEFKYDHNEIRLIDGLRELGFIKYNLNNANILTISQLEVNEKYKSLYFNLHIGTFIFNELLLYLYRKDINFDEIKGTLSGADAFNGNWITSISFYADFVKYLSCELNYTLSFNLYDINNNLYKLSENKTQRKVQINNFCVMIKNLNQNASFKYIRLPK